MVFVEVRQVVGEMNFSDTIPGYYDMSSLQD